MSGGVSTPGARGNHWNSSSVRFDFNRTCQACSSPCQGIYGSLWWWTAACSGLPLDEAFVVENREKALVMASADAREGPRAFMEKCAPDYQGR